jgi:uncharacterized NAD(P)/FAD-binding protein YdhS/predicted metal-dependent enzyme (double-stranded beta helix superfamily)
MDECQGRLADLARRLDGLAELSLTNLANALAAARLTVADVRDYVHESQESYNRALVVRRSAYELLILTWKPGQGSVPHDHAGSISAMQVLQGGALEGSWRIAPDGYVDQEFETPVRCGEMTAWQDAGVHTVRNPSNSAENLITVHVYAPPLKDFRRFIPRPTSNVRPGRQDSADVPTVVVVGGGFSGSMAAAQLLRQAAAAGLRLRVVLVERQGAVGEGLAYATRDPAHLLNVPAGRMSAWPNRPDDFVNWACRRHQAVAPGEFLPRQWYGEYVRQTLIESAEAAAGVASMTVSIDEVRRIARRPSGGWMVSFARGASLPADVVVLAIGHRPPPDPIGKLWSGSRGRFILDPWRPFALNPLRGDEPVVVLGSGLTAVDAVLTLTRGARTAPITLVSRRGLLPHSHAEAALPPIDLAPLIADWMAADRPRVVTLARKLKQKARSLAEAGGDWRSVVDSLRPHTAKVWSTLTERDRGRFLAHLRPYWEIHRHRMAVEVARRFRELLTQNLVRVVPGTVASVHADDSGARLYVRERGDARLIELRACWVVNCTGPAACNSAESNPAIGSLLVHDWVRRDALSLGLDTTSDGNAIDAKGREVDDLFVVGTLRKPLLWESTAVPELRSQAASVAQSTVAGILENRRKIGKYH